MCPAVGVEPHGEDDRSNSTAMVQLVHSQRVPSQKGTFLGAQVETSASAPLMFEPNRDWMASMGLEVEDSVIHSDAKGRIWIPVSSHYTGTVELQPNVPIGSVVALSEREVYFV